MPQSLGKKRGHLREGCWEGPPGKVTFDLRPESSELLGM